VAPANANPPVNPSAAVDAEPVVGSGSTLLAAATLDEGLTGIASPSRGSSTLAPPASAVAPGSPIRRQSPVICRAPVAIPAICCISVHQRSTSFGTRFTIINRTHYAKI
jgi:hypothetical protein